MKKGFWRSGRFLFAILVVAGPAALRAQNVRPTESKARLFVAEFRDKSAGGGLDALCLQQFGMTWRAVGEGMRDMMTTALFKTDRFLVLEREQLAEVMREQDLGASGRVQKGTEPPKGEIQGADLMIVASVTEFDSGVKSLKGSIDIGGIKVGGRTGKAHMAIDIRVVDVKTSQIVAATTVEGRASSVGVDGSKDPFGILPPSLGAFKKTPIEKALRACIEKSVQYICEKTPPEYFRYK